MTLEALGFIIGVAGTAIAAIIAYLNSDNQQTSQSNNNTAQVEYHQPTYYSAPQWNAPAYSQPMQAPVNQPVAPTTTNPWGTMAYISTIANTQTPTQNYASSPSYYSDLGYSTCGPQWNPPAATNYGVGNDIRPSPTGAPPGWTPPPFAPASAYW